MAKGYKEQNLAKLEKMVSEQKPAEQSKQRSQIYINSKGIEVTLVPIAPYLVELASSSIEIPKPPTYTIITAEGGEETFNHDEKSVAQSDDATKEKWSDYQRELKIADKKSTEVLMNIITVEGIKLDVIPDEAKWEKRQKLMGIPVPEDPEERLMIYKKGYLLASPEDIEEIVRIVIEMTMVSKEEIASAKKMFPNSLESEASEGNGSTSG